MLNELLVKGSGNMTSGSDLDCGQSMQDYKPEKKNSNLPLFDTTVLYVKLV